MIGVSVKKYTFPRKMYNWKCLNALILTDVTVFACVFRWTVTEVVSTQLYTRGAILTNIGVTFLYV